MAGVDKYGINIHGTNYVRYQDSAAVINLLNWLQIKWVRIDASSNPAQYSMYKAAGFSVVVVCIDAATATAALNANAADVIECVNEPNTNGITAAACRTTNDQIVTAVAGRVPVLTSALADPPDNTYASTCGAIAGADGAIHVYRAMRTPAAWATWKTQHYDRTLQFMAPNRNYMVTEFGTHDCLAFTGGHTPTPDYIAAQQILTDAQSFFTDAPTTTTGRCQRVFAYELVSASNSNQDTDTNDQHFFGIAYPDFKPKAHAFPYRDLIRS